MDITDVRVRKVSVEGKMRAIVSVTLDNEFVVHDIKVIEGENGLFIAMPSKKGNDGEYRDIAHPINSATREKIQQLILEAYQRELASARAKNMKTQGTISAFRWWMPSQIRQVFLLRIKKERR